ncbi:major capsid protein [Methylococcus mesophilus]|uniref:major capsid protein n=1 Tax=Methylococcus mesophilus TaxID=2993564 RepID=UPI00224A55D8|nr:major capsid protein [Methylococcus mesophilus]UZR29080.1 major capsid protein [Methylococcus mesophilus]
MAETRIADVIVPEIFQPYVIQRTTELSALWAAGIVAADPRVIPGPRAGGETVKMPYWNDLDGDAEELSDQKALTVNNIGTGQDVSVVQALGKAFGANDLAYTLAGDDPMRAIGDLFAQWWVRQMQKRLLGVLHGAFAATNMSGSILDISAAAGAAAVIDKASFADAAFLLGDASAGLTAVAMHSATYTKLYKDDLLDTEKGSDGTTFASYQGKRVIIDDGMPVAAGGLYTTYLFGPGAIAYAEGQPKTPVENDRHSLAGYDVLINRRHFVLHPRGIKWTGTEVLSTGDALGGHPTLAETADGANWTRVYEPKAIRMVAFKHKLA